MDSGNTKVVDFVDFKRVLTDYKFDLNEDDIKELFLAFDVNKNGSIVYDEFLRIIRVPNYIHNYREK